MKVKNKISGNEFFVRSVCNDSVFRLDDYSPSQSSYEMLNITIKPGQFVLLPKTAAGEIDQSWLIVVNEERLKNDFESIS